MEFGMRAVLEILDGPLAGRTISLSPGQTLSVGRTAKSQLMLPHDGFLSGMHFQIDCGDDALLLKDCNSSNGTFLNGEKVGTQILKTGDEILAGQTHFRLHMEASPGGVDPGRTSTVLFSVPKPIAETGMIPVPGSLTPQHQWIVNFLKAQQAPLYSLLDAAVNPKIQQVLVGSGEPYDLVAAPLPAPQLVQVSPESPLLPALVREAWSKGMVTFLTCRHPFVELRNHLRRFAIVQLEDGQKLPFRFYDPRLLQFWLAGCSPEELGLFFGPLLSVVIEDATDSTKLIEYRVTPQGLARTVHPIG
jgi:pSer/pThr/pTyr-binding forkhead associated (FHA) protein